MTEHPGPVPLRDRSFVQDQAVKLSICCITFNHAAFIATCLDGFLDQCCDFRVEILIYDDASTDATAAIIRDYAARHPTIFRASLMTENQFSKGVNPYFGHVFPAARGEYIAICDGDDYWADPVKLARQAAVLDAEPGIALTFGPVRGIDEAGADTPYCGGATRDLTAAELKAAVPINTLTACFRNIFRDAPVPLYVRTATIGDLMVWAMLGYHGSARFLPDLAPAFYRLRSGGLISMQGRDRQIMMTAIAQMHLAGYHLEQNDARAMEAAMVSMAALFNANGQGALIYQPSSAVSLRIRLFRLRKQFTRWRKSVSVRNGRR